MADQKPSRPHLRDFDSVDAYREAFEEYVEWRHAHGSAAPHHEQDYPLVRECAGCGDIATISLISVTDDPVWMCKRGVHEYNAYFNFEEDYEGENENDESETDGRFDPLDRVIDRESDDDDPSPARVLGYVTDDDGEHVRADEHHPDGLNNTIAGLNPGCDPGEPVVKVAFERWLDANNIPLDSMDDFTAYCDEWNIPVKHYDYPESRLEPIGEVEA